MENKEEIIKNTIKKFASVASKYCQSEDIPIKVDENNIITTREAHIIQAIGNGEDVGVTYLGKHFGVSKSAASQMVSKLNTRGFVDKKKSETNNKEIKLVLTDHGKKAFDAHDKAHKGDRAYLVSKMSTFSLSQIATLSVMLEAIENVMEERIEKDVK